MEEHGGAGRSMDKRVEERGRALRIMAYCNLMMVLLLTRRHNGFERWRKSIGLVGGAWTSVEDDNITALNDGGGASVEEHG